MEHFALPRQMPYYGGAGTDFVAFVLKYRMSADGVNKLFETKAPNQGVFTKL